jgi:hypothetical protein
MNEPATWLNCWEQQFPTCPPIGYLLRRGFADRWVRFHSLLESKRYPENAAEYATLLHRHNSVVEELTGTNRRVTLLATEFSRSAKPARLQAELQPLVPTATYCRTVPMDDLDGSVADPIFWHLYVSVHEWFPGLFDPIVRLVADDVISNIMIVGLDCRWVVHPYDGGMDVFAESSSARDRLKAIHTDWLSRRPDGL